MNQPKATKALIILDGWGQSETSASNAIKTANTPNWDHLIATYPNTLIGTSGADVGLPDGQMGNSEVGHMNIGAGRIVYQNYTRVSKALCDGSFYENDALVNAIATTKANQGTVHICGLLSDGGVHSHIDHILGACKMAHVAGVKLVLHAWLDGRDTPPRSALASLEAAQTQLQTYGAHIGSIAGRYFAMDRDQRWERIEPAYNAMCGTSAQYQYTSPIEALKAAYARDENDEFVTPCIIADSNGQHHRIQDGDSMICMNFRPDRSREITQAFVAPNLTALTHSPIALCDYVMLTEFSAELNQYCACAFPPLAVNNDLGEVIANNGLAQLRIAETEKYAHVTFFFSGGQEALYDGEERKLIASPKVATYDLQPEMSAPELTDKLVSAITSGKFDLIVCNFANADMVGHTGKFNAAVQAVEAVDSCLGRIAQALTKVNGEAFITADHGNVELMQNPTTGQPHTAHTAWPVPLIYVHNSKASTTALRTGVLADIAPTILTTMGLAQPAEMTGTSLLLDH